LPSFENTLGRSYGEIGQFAAYARRKIESRRDGRKPVVYPFGAVDMFGHVWFDAHALHAVYPGSEYQVFFFRPPIPPKFQDMLFDLPCRGFEIVEVDDFPLQTFFRLSATVFYERPDFLFGDITFVFGGASNGARHLYRRDARTRPFRATMSLTEEEKEQGRRLVDGFGLDHDRPFIVLHARETGYNPAHWHNAFRDCDIATYRPALAALVESGYSVVRIGDPSMRPLGLDLRHVHDAIADRHPLLHPWLVQHCAFFIHCFSGPLELARAYGRPTLGINCHPGDVYPPEPGQVYVFKKFEEIRTGRRLDFAEIVARRFTLLWHQQQLDGQGLRLVDNAPEEIAEACLDFAATLATGPAPQPRFEAFCRKESELRRASNAKLPWDRDFFMDVPGTSMAPAFMRRQPDFLDRDPPPIETRPLPPEPMSQVGGGSPHQRTGSP
jgi:putative glycosyltransferase (TIGR04372 family)